MKRRFLWILYTLLLYLLFPFILFYLYLFRGKKQPAYRMHLAERFGFFKKKYSNQKFIWIHAVSVGETRAVQKLIHTLIHDFPESNLLLTHSTPTGRETGALLYRPFFEKNPERFVQIYLPYDYHSAINRFFDHFNIEWGLLVETEIWFHLIHEAKKRSVPLFLINARLSEKSGQKYAHSLFYDLTKSALTSLTGVYTQSEGDTERFQRYLNFTPQHTFGNLKFDLTPPIEQIHLGQKWSESWHKNAKNIIIFASTRDGEEVLLLKQIILQAEAFADTLFLFVPRHPQRFSEVATLIEASGIAYQKRSQLLLDANFYLDPDTKILLGDSLGELFAYYQAADITFVGGSLLPYGCQNIIEPALLGKPLLFGPSVFNFAEVTQLALKQQAAIQVNDAAQLFEALSLLIKAPVTCAKVGQAATQFASAHQGTTTQTLSALKAVGVFK